MIAGNVGSFAHFWTVDCEIPLDLAHCAELISSEACGRLARNSANSSRRSSNKFSIRSSILDMTTSPFDWWVGPVRALQLLSRVGWLKGVRCLLLLAGPGSARVCSAIRYLFMLALLGRGATPISRVKLLLFIVGIGGTTPFRGGAGMYPWCPSWQLSACFGLACGPPLQNTWLREFRPAPPLSLHDLGRFLSTGVDCDPPLSNDDPG